MNQLPTPQYINVSGSPSSDTQRLRMATRLRGCILTVAMVTGLMRLAQGQESIGIDYGTLGNNLPTPAQVVSLLQSRSVKHVRIYNTDSSVLTAFANSGIDIGVTIPKADVAGIANDAATATQWVQTNIQAYSGTKFASIAVGNEYLADTSLDTSKLLPAMQNIQQALQNAGVTGIQVSTPCSMDGLLASPGFPPSSGTFNTALSGVLNSILAFLSQHGSVFMVNVYPFFTYRNNSGQISLDYALLNPSAATVTDDGSGLQYHNLFDAQVDTVISAMTKLGYGNLGLVVTETGWASGPDGELGASVQNAQSYNGNLVKHVLGGGGTPARPNQIIPTFLFALFNENQKVGNPTEQHFGLYNPDQTAVYDIPLTTASSLDEQVLRNNGSAIQLESAVRTAME